MHAVKLELKVFEGFLMSLILLGVFAELQILNVL